MNSQPEKIALVLQYNGARYHGWQNQGASTATVQGSLEEALSKIAGGEPIKTYCAGRTDAGVHASAQVVHFETTVKREDKAWCEGVNTLLPQDIGVRWACRVDDDFHARFSATSRRYRYFIWNETYRPALHASQLTWFRYPLDEELMHEAAQALIGEHDFQSFRAAACQSRSSFRYVSAIDVKRVSNTIIIDIEANAFLLHMVRNIVGSLILVGQGHKPVSWFCELLAAKDRRMAGMTAAPNGLNLVKVKYPPHFTIPEFPPPLLVEDS